VLLHKKAGTVSLQTDDPSEALATVLLAIEAGDNTNDNRDELPKHCIA